MTHTLWRSAELLGEGDLEPLAAVAGALGGMFRPTPAFAAVWPALSAARAASLALGAALNPLPSGASADEIRAQLVVSGAGDAIAAALAAVEALGLEVRDAGGCALADVQVGVSLLPPPVLDDLTPEQRAAAERDATAVGVALGGPNYLLVVNPRRVVGGAGAGGSAGAS